MTSEKRTELTLLALKVRERILRMATDGGCFIGASLSCADIIVFLYASGILKISPGSITDPARDIVLLSKGHDVPALYGTLAELGYFDERRLGNHLSSKDAIYWHPNRSVPGIEFHSGSLGHLLAVGMGFALDAKLRHVEKRVYVILGDGELNEGSVWEAMLVATAKKLDNLVVIVDRNQFQANVMTEELVPLESLERKFESFGWTVETIDGHSFDDLEDAIGRRRDRTGSPSAIIAQTVRGKGIPSIERRADRWFVNFSATEILGLADELHGRGNAVLHSPELTVR
jgi:transketolase